MLIYKGENKVKSLSAEKMNILITPLAYKKMTYIIDECSSEVGWLGQVEKISNGDILVKDIFLFDQEVNSTTCEISPESIAQITEDIYAKNENPDKIISELALWGHSHVNMSTTPSGQDNKQLLDFGKSGVEWFLGVIGNKKGELNFSYIDFKRNILVEDISWRVFVPELENDINLRKSIKKDLKEKVKAIQPVNYATWQKGVYVRNSLKDEWEEMYIDNRTQYNSQYKDIREVFKDEDEYDSLFYELCDMDYISTAEILFSTIKEAEPVKGRKKCVVHLNEVELVLSILNVYEIESIADKVLSNMPKLNKKKNVNNALNEINMIADFVKNYVDKAFVDAENIKESHRLLTTTAKIIKMMFIDDIGRYADFKENILDILG